MLAKNIFGTLGENVFVELGKDTNLSPRTRKLDTLKRKQQACLATLNHMRLTKLIHETRPFLQANTSLIPEDPSPKLPDYFPPHVTHPFTGEYSKFLAAGSRWQTLAHDMLIAEEDPAYRAIIEAHNDIRGELELISKNAQKYEPEEQHRVTFHDSTLQITRSMIAWRDSYIRHHGHTDSETLTATALAHTKTMAIAADFGRGFYHKQVQYPQALLDETDTTPLGHEAFRELGYDGIFTADGRWNEDRLNTSPAEKYACPVNMALVSPHTQDREEAEEYFSSAGGLAGQKISRRGEETPGKFDGSTAVTVFAALLAKETLFADPTLPSREMQRREPR